MPEQKSGKEAEPEVLLHGIERRQEERVHCDLQLSWRILGRQSGESWGARIHDVSTKGIALRVPCWIKPGTVLVVRLHGAGERFSRPLPIRVMHSTQTDAGDWLVGGMFVRPLLEEEMRRIAEAG
jgi:hypothetical protein